VPADDIAPESGCRLPLVMGENLDPEAKAIYDSLIGGGAHTVRGLRGPGGIKMHSPKLARCAIPVSRYLRFESGLSGRVREVAILITARCCHSQFEWAAHGRTALKEGVPAESVEAIRLGMPVDGLDPIDAVIITLGRETFLSRKVSSQTYQKALQSFGVRGLVDLAALMGEYASTAAVLTIFDMQLDEGVEPRLPAL